MPRISKKTSAASTTTPAKRGRIPAKLNIASKPGVGMAYALRRLSDNVLVRASTTCQRDKIDEDSKMYGKPLCKYSGNEPYFTMKLGAAKVGAKIIKMLCSPTLPFCEDTKNEYRFEGISLREALAQKLDVDQSAFYVSNEATSKPVKVKKISSVKKSKAQKKVARKTSKSPAAVVENAPDAPVSNVLTSNDEDVETTAENIVDASVPSTPAQSDEDFAKECDAEFEADLNKIQSKAQS